MTLRLRKGNDYKKVKVTAGHSIPAEDANVLDSDPKWFGCGIPGVIFIKQL